MALITCPDCKQKVSDSAPTCPGCGRPVAAGPDRQDFYSSVLFFAVLGFALGFCGIWWLGGFTKEALQFHLVTYILVGAVVAAVGGLLGATLHRRGKK